jgi:aspartokinase-like uncharacterized kinase
MVEATGARLPPGHLPGTIVKVGGSLTRDGGVLEQIMRVLSNQDVPLVVVPGGGVLADAVRALFLKGGLSMETAHRMAVLALDQTALWLAELARGRRPGQVVRSPQEIAEASTSGRLPVIAPAEWLEREYPLPASWEVTSDSIAAWLAGRIGAGRLVLVKSFAFVKPVMRADELEDEVDAFFLRALAPGVECRFLDGSEPARLAAALADGSHAGTLLQRST